MLDDSKRLRLAGLASTGSRGYSLANPRNIAGPAKQKANGMSDGDATLVVASRVSDRA
jgi:hypothetical protein